MDVWRLRWSFGVWCLEARGQVKKKEDGVETCQLSGCNWGVTWAGNLGKHAAGGRGRGEIMEGRKEGSKKSKQRGRNVVR